MRPDRSAHRRESLTLADGRRLAYTDTGSVGATPVVYCHGAIGTPVDATMDLARVTDRLGIRYIAPSRPGVGGSDPSPRRTILDFADDVNQLADALSLERISVAGVSAGGPYALALAHRLGDRVERVAVCSSLSPLCPPHRTPGMRLRIRLAMAAVARAPGQCEWLGDAVLPIVAAHPWLVSRVIAAHAAASERARLDSPDERMAASRSFLDAACGGVGGIIADYLTYSADWGFDAAEVRSEVHLWHGLGDPLVPVEHALQLATALRHCRIFFDPDEGHHFFRSSLGRILGVLIGREEDPGFGVETTIDGVRARIAQISGPGPAGHRSAA
jgi:pimeloyl-ACP methyl ester carboxylesterase